MSNSHPQYHARGCPVNSAWLEKQKNNPKCPKCDSEAIEIFSTVQPVGYTGIWRCLNEHCSVDTFDPNFDEGSPYRQDDHVGELGWGEE